jgi:hypothetical protein
MQDEDAGSIDDAAFASALLGGAATPLPPGFCAGGVGVPARRHRMPAAADAAVPFASHLHHDTTSSLAATAAAGAPADEVEDDGFHARAIAPGLWLGASSMAADEERLRARGITHVVNVAKEIPSYFPKRLTYLRLELADSADSAVRMRELLPRACDFIGAALASGGGVLVHCALGRSRSAAVLLAYALSVGWDLPRAAALLHAGRAGLKLNWGFEAMLQSLQSERDGTAGQRRLRSRAHA